MKKSDRYLLTAAVCILFSLSLTGCSDKTKSRLSGVSETLFSTSGLSSAKDLHLESDDETNYSFTYKGEEFDAEFLTDTWTVYNSYRIKNPKDILIICKALSEEHAVPSRDRESYRTPEDMAFEWEQHNLAYSELPDDNQWKESSRNVDLDPDDQGKTLKEIYEERTGKTLDLDTLLEHSDKIKKKIKEKLESEDINTEDIDFDKLTEKAKEKLKESDIDTDDLDFERLKEKLKEVLKDE